MAELSQDRPIFHSEADFQHALAWLIQNKFKRAKIRLEYPIATDSGRIYVDIWVTVDEQQYAIELKYKTSHLKTTVDNEEFHLRNQSAQDVGRYDFLKDVQRLESIFYQRQVIGIAIFLTNYHGYWNAGVRNTIDVDFHLHEKRLLTGNLAWSDRASKGTKKGREDQIIIKNIYPLLWNHYSTVGATDFNYLLLEIPESNG